MSTQAAGKDAFVLFELAGTSYGVASRQVQQIEMVAAGAESAGTSASESIPLITVVPNAPPHVEGVVLTRGQVVPALNLRKRFGLPAVPHDLRTRLIVVHAGDRAVGLIVDVAREFVNISAERLQPPPETLLAVSGGYIEAVATLGERLVLILDVDRVVDPAVAGVVAQASA